MKRRIKLIVAILLACSVVGLAVIDRHVTAARNAADRDRLQTVKLGMSGDAVVRIIGIEPIQMETDPRMKEIFVWERSTVVHSILHPNHPTVGKTITIQDGRVVNISVGMIFR